MQGTKFSNIKFSIQVDTLGKECYTSSEGLFLYKKCVYVPPLGMIDDVASFAFSGPEAIKTNAIINAKIESKKLEFGPSKFYNIHLGKNQDTQSLSKVHNQPMNVKNYETCLGDVICNSGTNDKNIDNRRNQGLAAISQIVSMLNLISLGHCYFEISLILRDSILISKLTFNSEIWYNLTKVQINKLEQIDEMYMRKVFNVARTVPKEGLYIECGKMPIKFIIKMRRMMFLWHILSRNKDELLFKFYTAQKLAPSIHDWVHQIDKDKEELNLELSDEEIRSMTKQQFKKLLKQKIEKLARGFLKNIQNFHSKTKNLELKTFTPQDYLLSKNLNTQEVQNLYKLRNNMIDVKENFKSSHTNNMWCKTCSLFTETQQHLVDCQSIKNKLHGIVKFEELKYNMIYGKTKEQEFYAKNYTLILAARQDILESEQQE